MSKLNIDQKSVKALFSEKKADFLIPDYQRPYAWGEKECQTLWDDLFLFAFPENDCDMFNSDSDEYFLGPIVTFKNSNGKIEIIDGQQRLTTLMLLLRAFYEKYGSMKNDKAVKTSKFIEQCIWKTDEFGDPDKSALKIDSEVATDKEKGEFLSILKTGKVSDGEKSSYASNYRFFQQRIVEFLNTYPDWFSFFPIRIMNNCILLPIEAESQDTPVARLKRVAAYARVSCSKEAMLHSLEAQVSQYSRLIQSHNGWQYMGVYADEAITGTKESRAEFQRLLTDCRAGKIDMILTKSISRFARNTVTTLSAIRELKALGVDVYFEEQNIHSISADGELMITIMASFAQEESRSVSENCKWTIRKKFQKGEPTFFRCYGYKWVNGQLEIVPEQAEVVRMIFRDYLDGMGEHAIINKLNDLGIPSRDGCKWNLFSIRTVLHNERYIGDLLLQKSYVVDHLSKKQRKNTGELPQYYVTDAHEPIVPRELFDAVQAEFSRRAAYYSQKKGSAHGNRFPFSGLIVCGLCGCAYRRKITKAGTKYAKPVWICHTFNSKGKHACASKQIPEIKLYEAACTALEIAEFDEDAFENQIDHIEVTGPNSLRFITKQGDARDIDWQDASRADSWTPEMKAQAAGYARKGR